MTWISGLRDWMIPAVDRRESVVHVPAGLYHFHRDRDGEHIRYHLRVDEGGPAILLAAASEAVLLSAAGAAVARGWLEGKSLAELDRRFSGRVHSESVQHVVRALEDLGRTSIRYPVFNLVDPAYHERTWRLSAPFQADIELARTATARRVVDQVWQSRIPHVRWIVTPRCDRDGVVTMVTHTEDAGMIAGVRAHSIRWFQPQTLRQLAEVGLDYVVFPWGVIPEFHDAWFGLGDMSLAAEVIAEVRGWEMTPVATIPLLPWGLSQLTASLDQLQQLGVHHVEVFAVVETTSPAAGLPANRRKTASDIAPPDDLPHESTGGFLAKQLRQLAACIEDLADSRRMQIVWLPPHARAPGEDTLATIRRGPRAGGDVSIRIDASGNVIPPRGPLRSAGNIITDPWESIWDDAGFRRYRGRLTTNTRCAECPGMAICAADCPAETASWVLPP